MMLKLKIEFNGEIRRTQVPNPLSMASLREAVKEMFATDIVASKACISYVDDEGDKIMVTQDIELQEAVHVFNGKTVKLRISASKEPTEESAGAASDAACDLESAMGAAVELLPEALKLFGDYVAAGLVPPEAVEKVLIEMPELSAHADLVRQHFHAVKMRERDRRHRGCTRGRGRGRGRGCGRGRHHHGQSGHHGHGRHGHGHGHNGRGRGGFLRGLLQGSHGPLLGLLHQPCGGLRGGRGMRHGGMRHSARRLGLGATFVRDVSLPDHMELPAGSVHVKTWSFQNTGTVQWPQGTKLHFVKGAADVLQGHTEFDVPCAKPGEQVEISVPVHVRACPPLGAHVRRRDRRLKAVFRLMAPVGSFQQRVSFGDRVWLNVNVVASDTDVDALVKQARATLGDRVTAFSDGELQQLLAAFDNDVGTFVRDVLGGSA
ncbi:MAG: hypothetical protein MHM6MM_005003 [Cercozoa sp. M6MM]